MTLHRRRLAARGRPAFLVPHRRLAVAAFIALAGACGRAEPDALSVAAADSAVGAASTPAGDSTAARADTVVLQVSDTDTLITVSNRSGWKPAPLEEHISNDYASDGYTVKVLDRRRGADGGLYLLVRDASPSRSPDARGYCAAGEEAYLTWLAADSALQVVRKASVMVESCLFSRELDEEPVQTAGEPWRLRFRIHMDTLGIVEYDRTHPERGIRVTQMLDGRYQR